MKKVKIILIILFFSILILLLLSSTLKYKESFENEENANIHLIISRYNEDLQWLKDEPFNKYSVTIYNKGTNEDFYKPVFLKEVIQLENVGVCVHSYLYFIINNYDNLPNVTVFLPGSCMDDHKKEKTLMTIEKTDETKDSVFYVSKYENPVLTEMYDFHLDTYSLANRSNRNLNNDDKLKKCELRPFGKWYEKLFPNVITKYVNYYGIFSVSKEHILYRSKHFYEELIQYVNKDKNEESAHYFERSFLAIFNTVPEKCIYT